MPDISPEHMAWLLQRDGAEPGLWLATITGPDFPEAVRFVRNFEDIGSRGELFVAMPFNISPPSDTTAAPAAQFEVPNVNGEIGLLLLEGNSGMVIDLELVRHSQPDVVIYAARRLKLRVGQITALTVSGEISVASLSAEPYVGLRVSPAAFPGLYLAAGAV